MKMRAIAAGLGLSMLLTACGSGIQAEQLVPAEKQQTGTEVQLPTEVKAPTEVQELSREDALWQFSHQLFGETIEETNPVLSPVSAYLAMGMAGLGAKGDTLAEFEAVLGRDMQEVAGQLVQQIPVWLTSEDEESLLTVANSAWIDDEMVPEETWLSAVSDVYGAEVFRTVLSGNQARKDINQWVEKSTHSLIKNFLGENLDEKNRLVLLNAVYFKGKWKHDFKERNTFKEAFTKADGTEKQVDMLHAYNQEEYYVKNERMDGVVLDYQDGSMAFVALKPVNGESVRELYEKLTQEEWNALLDSGEKTTMNLKMPKFETECDVKLNDALIHMGIQKAFRQTEADFSGLGTGKNGSTLCIDQVRQKAVVKLDEKGTEAAAVTIVQMTESECIELVPPIEVYFDEPFLYMIMEKESRTPLFIGIMDEP